MIAGFFWRESTTKVEVRGREGDVFSRPWYHWQGSLENSLELLVRRAPANLRRYVEAGRLGGRVVCRGSVATDDSRGLSAELLMMVLVGGKHRRLGERPEPVERNHGTGKGYFRARLAFWRALA
jgi:hypothetical protein